MTISFLEETGDREPALAFSFRGLDVGEESSRGELGTIVFEEPAETASAIELRFAERVEGRPRGVFSGLGRLLRDDHEFRRALIGFFAIAQLLSPLARPFTIFSFTLSSDSLLYIRRGD